MLCVFTAVWWIYSYVFPQSILMRDYEADIMFSLDTRGNMGVNWQEMYPGSKAASRKGKILTWSLDSQVSISNHWDHHFSISQKSLWMYDFYGNCGRKEIGVKERQNKMDLQWNQHSIVFNIWELQFVTLCVVVSRSVCVYICDCQWNCFIYSWLWCTIKAIIIIMVIAHVKRESSNSV